MSEEIDGLITGIFVRVERDGKWQSLDVAQLTPEELETFANQHPHHGWNFAKALVKWIQENVEVVD